MAHSEKISNIFKDIRRKVQTHAYIPPTVSKKNTVEQQPEKETIRLTKKK